MESIGIMDHVFDPDPDPEPLGLAWLFSDEEIGYASTIPLSPEPDTFGLKLLFSEDPENDLSEVISLRGTPDFLICVESNGSSYSWQVHSSILCQHSEYFNSVCNGSFLEGTQRKITLQDNPWLIGRMLEFMYTGECESIEHNPLDFHEGEIILHQTLNHYMNMGLMDGDGVDDDGWYWNSIQTHTRMQAALYVLADMYQILGLKLYLANHLKFHGQVICFTIFIGKVEVDLIKRDLVLKEAISRELCQNLWKWWKDYPWVRKLMRLEVDLFLVVLVNLDPVEDVVAAMFDPGRQLCNIKEQVYKRFNVTDDEWIDMVYNRDST